MNAIKFIKENGVEKAMELLARLHKLGCPDDMQITVINGMWHRTANGFTYPDLKRLVESVDLVNSNGGWNGTKNTITLFQSSLDIGLYHGVDGVNAEVEIPRLKQAIADYEAIFGGEHV